MVCFLALTMVLAGIGVMCFIVAGVRWAAMQRLLREGEFSPAGKRRTKVPGAVGTAYWLLATAIYLGWSFLTDDWHTTWVVWPIAGVLYAGVMALCGLFEKR